MMAALARQTGRLADARAHLREAVELAMHAGYRMRLIDAVEEAGYWCAATGQYAAAVTLWAARDAQTDTAGLADTPIRTTWPRAAVCRRRGRHSTPSRCGPRRNGAPP